jgi:phage-related protein
MSDKETVKPTIWVGSSLTDLKEFPPEVQNNLGYALYFAQTNLKHPKAKPLKGFKGASVLEIVEDYDGDTYHAVYTVKLAGIVYVLHVFHKKSKHGIATPKQDMELIENRLQLAIAHYRENYER